MILPWVSLGALQVSLLWGSLAISVPSALPACSCLYMSILCHLSWCSESGSQTWQASRLAKISRWTCYNVCTMVFSYWYYLPDFPSPLMLINACKHKECVFYEVFFCRLIISHCLFWQNFINTPHIDSSTKPASPTQPSGVPGLFQRSLSSLQEHRLAAAPAGSCVGQCQTAGAGRGCLLTSLSCPAWESSHACPPHLCMGRFSLPWW